MYHDITHEVDDPVAVLRLDRPEKLNASTSATSAEVRVQWESMDCMDATEAARPLLERRPAGFPRVGG